MNLSILILILLLSTVVVKITDSCSSFTRWKFRQVDTQINEYNKVIEKLMTTERIDLVPLNETNNKNISTSRMYKPITTPIIIPSGAKFEKCEEGFEEIFCSQHGKCIIIDYNSGSEKQPQCICDQGFTGIHCMEKSPDYTYTTVKERNILIEESLKESTMQTINNITLKNIMIESNRGEQASCPSPWKEDYCINGECFIIPHLSNSDYFCNCHRDFTGKRCTEKLADFHYEIIISAHSRERRDISADKRRKYKANPRFRAVT